MGTLGLDLCPFWQVQGGFGAVLVCREMELHHFGGLGAGFDPFIEVRGLIWLGFSGVHLGGYGAGGRARSRRKGPFWTKIFGPF